MKLLDIMQEAWGHKNPDRAVEWDHTAKPTLDNLQAMSADREFAVYDKSGKKLGTFKDLDTFLLQIQKGRAR
jgi:hypothetical protein